MYDLYPKYSYKHAWAISIDLDETVLKTLLNKQFGKGQHNLPSNSMF